MGMKTTMMALLTRDEVPISKLSKIRIYSDHLTDRKLMPKIRIIEYTIFRAFFADLCDFLQRIIFFGPDLIRKLCNGHNLYFKVRYLFLIDTISQLITALERKFKDLQNEPPYVISKLRSSEAPKLRSSEASRLL